MTSSLALERDLESSFSPNTEGPLSLSGTAEVIRAAAVDPIFYSKFFFPRTIRQSSPAFHRDGWALLEDPRAEYVSLMWFRGGAKTTIFRIFASRRIAYGISRTIVLISRTEGHAVASLQWIRRAVEHNRRWAQVFQLRPGGTWRDDQCEIIHGIDEVPIRLIALGITGHFRGINWDDFRPDFILADDPDNEETTGTVDQRKKTANLFFGALQNSLAPKSESPMALMALAQTPLHSEDLICQTLKDPSWLSTKVSCFNAGGDSVWPARWTTQELLEKKAAFAARNQLSLWFREWEVTITSPETSSFKEEWLKFWDVLPEDMVFFMGIDPSTWDQKKPEEADFQAFSIVGVHGLDTYLIDYSTAKAEKPDAAAAKFFNLYNTWHPLLSGVESTAYQKALKWYLEREMDKIGLQAIIIELPRDPRPKRTRIIETFTNRCVNGRFFVHRTHTDFIKSFIEYPDVDHDDLLDATSMAIQLITPRALGGEGFAAYAAGASEAAKPIRRKVFAP